MLPDNATTPLPALSTVIDDQISAHVPTSHVKRIARRLLLHTPDNRRGNNEHKPWRRLAGKFQPWLALFSIQKHRRGPEQLNYLDRLPDDLLLEMFLGLANEPNRHDAHAVTKIRELNKYWQGWIASIAQLSEKDAALRRNPGIASRLVALCRDVICGGIAAKDALRQNGPLPQMDKSDQFEVMEVLRKASPYHIADLTEALSQRRGAAPDGLFLWSLANVVTRRLGFAFIALNFYPGIEPTADWSWFDNVGQIVALARAFSRNIPDTVFLHSLEGLANVFCRLDLVHLTIEQIATLAEAYGTKNGANFATNVLALRPLLATELARQAVGNFTKHANAVLEKLAARVSAHGEALLSQADTCQLDTIRWVLIECGGRNCLSAVAKIDDFRNNCKFSR